jgi:hypothetical protein
MTSDSIKWPDCDITPVLKKWVTEYFATADSRGDEAAERFADFFDEDALMVGLGEPIHGKQGRLKVLLIDPFYYEPSNPTLRLTCCPLPESNLGVSERSVEPRSIEKA